jgi:signal transduction histidine kinase
MFEKARIELTAWYLLIIMSISILFSGWVYQSVSMDLEKRLVAIDYRVRQERMGFVQRGRGEALKGDLESARRGLVLILTWANGAILILAGGAGYVLAGKTLSPIEEALDEQKRFIADASHELKTPLTVLKTSIEVALRKKKMGAKEAREIIESNLEEVEDLQKLTENLLTLARYQEGKSSFVFEKANLREISKRAVKRVSILAKKKGVKIEEKLNEVFLVVDKERIEELLIILLDNGVKYNKKGGVVRISLEEKKGKVILKVKDEGEGMGKKDLPHVFDRFYRADQSRSRQNKKGFGLGLSVAKKIVELHKGNIGVTSKKDKGSEFKVRL